MSTLRKNTFVQRGKTVGQIASISGKKVTLVDGSTINSNGLKKITKKEYTAIVNAASANVKPKKTANPKAKVEAKPKKISVAQQSRDLFVELTKNAKTERKDVISAFKEVLSLSQRGAETYYYNCTKMRKADKL